MKDHPEKAARAQPCQCLEMFFLRNTVSSDPSLGLPCSVVSGNEKHLLRLSTAKLSLGDGATDCGIGGNTPGS